ncbi:HDOD domain-containing protein [Nitrincola tapanii]|uniref:HDOD domain-containing protein n=1 Tax=Nitrincola tapanii TaxID=1708751 RepID=A0A5A9W3H0_9GAMM|nr:HDOD domain-containing protein [Nitrincola tapanii]KAA0875310.1 HDOD domain-containing protein [Nitrincola tapanii]
MALKYQETLNRVYAQLDRLGDLPVFSATVNHIRQISSSSDTDAMSLAIAVMKDPNLTTKLLRLANSSEFNRGGTKVTAVSRAVVLIGFERIRNLCMTLKLIESFGEKEPGTQVEDLLVAAVLNAATARDMAISAGVLDIEETYICGLLFGLGEIVVAFTLPELYREMLQQRKQGLYSWTCIQQQALGGQFVTLGRDLIQTWGFAKSVVNTLRTEELVGQSSAQEQLNHKIVSGCYELFEQIYHRSEQVTGEEYNQQLSALSEACRLPEERVETLLGESVRLLCEHIEEYGLSHKSLIPPVKASGNEQLDEVTRKLAFYLHSRQDQQKQKKVYEVEKHHEEQKRALDFAQQQLAYLDKMSALINEKAAAPRVLATCVEAIEASSSLERVVFCLAGQKGDQLKAKLLEGVQLEPLLSYFDLERSHPQSRLFFHILDRGVTLLVADARDVGWQQRLPLEFLQQVRPSGLIIAPLMVAGKAIGLLYADKTEDSGLIEDSDFRVFNQFLLQSRLALELSKSSGADKPLNT